MVPCSALRCRTVRCIALQKCCGRLLDHCGALWCIAVHCLNVAEGLRATVVLAVHCGTVQKRCGRVADHRGTLQCLTVHCDALHICYGRLVGHCGALWCVVVQCGNIVEGLQTIAVHCGVLYMLWKAYRLLRYLAVPYNVLRCTEEMLQKACG